MDEDLDQAKDEGIGYTFGISPHIYERLERHILILKRIIDRTTTKQRWIRTSIKEKLAKEAALQAIPKATFLNVKFDKELEMELIKKVEYVKKFRTSYSKKQWIVDAVLEKLDRDEKGVEAKFLESTQSQMDSYKNQNEKLLAEIDVLKTLLENAQKKLVKARE